MQRQTSSEIRLSILGYAQRGGSPTPRSRLLASLFAEKAVDFISQGQGNMAVGLQNGVISGVDLNRAANDKKPIDYRLLQIADMLST
jgi:6-phosphofructokinase 1